MTQPRWITVNEIAARDADLAARAINFLARFGRSRRLVGSDLAGQFNASCGSGSEEWKSLVSSLVLARPGPDSIGPADAEGYITTFAEALEIRLHALGMAGYETGITREPDDPRGPIQPWLVVLVDLEKRSRPSLFRRLIGRH